MSLQHVVEPGGLTPQHQEKIFELHEKRWSPNRIARQLGKHPGTVAWFMYSRGLVAPRQADVSRTYMRNGRQVRTFSRDDDAFMQALRVQDYGLREIARLISARTGHAYTEHSVHNRLVMLAAIDDA